DVGGKCDQKTLGMMSERVGRPEGGRDGGLGLDAARFEPRDQVFGKPVFAAPEVSASRNIEPQAAWQGRGGGGAVTLHPAGKRGQSFLNGFRFGIGADKLGV